MIADLRFYAKGSLKEMFWILFFDKSFRIIVLHRLMKRLSNTRFNMLNRLIYHRMAVKYNCYISTDAIIGKRVRLAHPFSVVIGAAVIEDDVTIFQNCTIGSHGNALKPRGYPKIRRGSVLYAGSTVIGDVEVGAFSIVSANALVKVSVPENSIVKSGNPSISQR